MNIKSILAYMQQPSTVSGIGTLLGGVVGAVTQHMTHDPAAALTLFAAVKGAAGIAIPDNSAAQQDLVTFSKDAVTAAVTRKLSANLAVDAFKLLQDFTAAPATTTTTTMAATTTTSPAQAAAAAPPAA